MEDDPYSSVFRPASPPRRMRACVPCSKAKARCNFQPGNIVQHLCDRCKRLGVECVVKTGRGLRRPRQITDVEGHVPNVVADTSEAFLTSFGGSPVVIPQAPGDQTRGNHTGVQPSTSASTRPAEAPLYGLTWHQISHFLHLFRSQYMHYFPFVVIDPAATPQQLFSEKQFLLRAIILVAAPLPESSISEIKIDVLAYLSQHMLVGEEQKLDLLQGLLVIIAWAHACQIRDGQVTNLSYLALGYSHGLEITRMPASLAQQPGERNSEDVLERARTRSGEIHSVEEQRTLLGVFCILSANSSQHLRQHPFDSPYIAHCCTALKSSPSSLNLLIERTVRMVQLSNKLNHAFGESHERSGAGPYAFLLEGSGRSFRTELTTAVEIAMHPDIEAHHAYFRLWGNYLLVRLYEPATKVRELNGEGIGPSMYRSLCLRNCLNAAKAYVDVLVSVEAREIVSWSIITREQLGFVMLMAARLLVLEAPDWDVKIARNYLDLVTVLSGVIWKLEAADALRKKAIKDFGGNDVEGGWVAEMARKMRLLKEGFEARLDGRVEGEPGEEMERDDESLWVRGWGIMVWGFPNV